MVSIGELDGWVSHEDAVTSPRANNNLGEYTACRTNSSVWMESLAAVRRISERGASRKDQRARKSRGPLLSFTRRSTRASVQQGQVFERRRPERAPSDEISLLGLPRPSCLFPGDRWFRHFARFHRNLLQAIDKPSTGGARRRLGLPHRRHR
jgi:hypothetical protein